MIKSVFNIKFNDKKINDYKKKKIIIKKSLKMLISINLIKKLSK